MTRKKAARFELDMKKCWVTDRDIGQGVRELHVWTPRLGMPIGTLWFVPFGPGVGGKKRVEVLSSYVPEHYRRNGVRTFMNDFLFGDLDVDVIVTASGSSDGGEAFMLAAGYERDEEKGMWYLTASMAGWFEDSDE